jgi:hypothetical protein
MAEGRMDRLDGDGGGRIGGEGVGLHAGLVDVNLNFEVSNRLQYSVLLRHN